MRQQQRRSAVRTLACACGGISLVSATLTHAAAITWDNGGGDQKWSTTTNWNPDGAPDANDLKFTTATGVTSNSTVTSIVDASLTVNSASFTQVGASAATVVYHTVQINDGATLTINGTGAALFAGSGVAGSATGADTSYTFFQNQPGALIGGTLAIDNPLADVTVRQSSTVTSGHMSTLDL